MGDSFGSKFSELSRQVSSISENFDPKRSPEISERKKRLSTTVKSLFYNKHIISPPSEPTTPNLILPEVNMKWTVPELPDLGTDEIRSIVRNQLLKSFFFDVRLSHDMEVTSIEKLKIYHYKLESFCEIRSLEWVVRSLKDGKIPESSNGLIPDPWDIEVKMVDLNSTKVMEVPSSDTKRSCQICSGSGSRRCKGCLGFGFSSCKRCAGYGSGSRITCTTCRGTGKQKCVKCQGYGRMSCKTCQGLGKLNQYLEMTVTWTNYLDEYIGDNQIRELKAEKVKGSNGYLVIDELRPKLYPLFSFPEEEITRVSEKFLNKQNCLMKEARTYHQRHHVKLIPVYKVNYNYQAKSSTLYICGLEKSVHFPRNTPVIFKPFCNIL